MKNIISNPAAPFHRPKEGAQSVDRALRLLHVLSLHGRQGMSLGDLAAHAGLDPATARRLLISLLRSGFVSQDQRSRRYFVGLDFFSIAAAAANRFDLGEARRGALRRLAHETSAASAFYMRDDDDVVCIDAVHDNRPQQAADIGARRPIGAEAYGLAVLAALPDEEGEAIAIRNVRRYSRSPEESIRQVGERLRQTRSDGYCVDTDWTNGRWEAAIAVTDRNGRPEGAIGLAVEMTALPAAAPGMLKALGGAARGLQNELWRCAGATGRLRTPETERFISSCEMPPGT